MSFSNIVAQSPRTARAQQKLSLHVVAKKARVAKALGVSPLYLLQELATDLPRVRRR